MWINNNLTDRLAMLQQTESAQHGINQVVIEKDWWVTVILKALFQTGCSKSLIFKGGTSLSKSYGIIKRFSEDIDLAISHSFFGIEKTTKNQRDKLRKTARKYIHEVLSPQLDFQLKAIGVSGYSIENVTHTQGQNGVRIPIDSDKDPTIVNIHYPSIVEETISYIPPRVKIEISCLSMDEPTEMREISSLICNQFPEEDIGTCCKVRTVIPTRTFLEKIFLLSEEFQKDNPRNMRMSRHLYDLERLMDTQYGQEALSNLELYNSIVEHRKKYFALKYVDYNLHNPATINFTIPQRALDAWRSDYAEMQRFFIYGDSLDFDTLMTRMEELQARVRSIIKK